jgi:hypothetical protein
MNTDEYSSIRSTAGMNTLGIPEEEYSFKFHREFYRKLKLTSLQSKANQPKPTTKATTKTAG